MKNKFAPTIVLGCICLIAALLLAAVNNVTAPLIAESEAKAANEARFAVLADADDFEDVTPETPVDGIISVHKAKNGTGYAIASGAKGFGGTIKVMVGINADGAIEKVQVTDNSTETAGLGSKTSDPEYTAQYDGALAITSESDGDGQYVKPISGATYSSKGVFAAVNAALEQFAQMGGAH